MINWLCEVYERYFWWVGLFSGLSEIMRLIFMLLGYCLKVKVNVFKKFNSFEY